jgi:N-acetylglucosamine-6-phosphate deacetylase
MSGDVLIYNVTLCLPAGPRPKGWLLAQGGHITHLGWREPPPSADAERLDAGGLWLAPGLIDLHAHGARGCDTMDATPDALRSMARFYASHGVTGFLATTMSASAEHILTALRNVAIVMAQGTGGAALLGAHVEGPYLDLNKRGCQDAAQIRGAHVGEYETFFATGVVRLITLAPEVPGSQELIRYAIEQGVRVAAGHTRATFDQMCAAASLGVSQVTHLYNGMELMHHRKPGAVGAALTLEELTCQLIADRTHVHPAILRLTVRAKGLDGVLLVTDAMGGAGMPDGEYRLGEIAVSVRQGVARTAEGALAGSTLTLDQAVSNMMVAADLTLPQALRLASLNPARALGIAGRKGRLAVGYDADLILVDTDVTVHLTLVEGQIVYRR